MADDRWLRRISFFDRLVARQYRWWRTLIRNGKAISQSSHETLLACNALTFARVCFSLSLPLCAWLITSFAALYRWWCLSSSFSSLYINMCVLCKHCIRFFLRLSALSSPRHNEPSFSLSLFLPLIFSSFLKFLLPCSIFSRVVMSLERKNDENLP